MDDEAIERILASAEKQWGEDNMELAAKYGRFRQVVVNSTLYGSAQEREKRVNEGKRASFTWKQYRPLSDEIKDRYGEGEPEE